MLTKRAMAMLSALLFAGLGQAQDDAGVSKPDKPKFEPKPDGKPEPKPEPKPGKEPKNEADAAIMTVSLKQLGGDYDAGVKLLTGMARVKFGEKAADGLTFGKKDGKVTVAGDEKVLAWLSEAVKLLNADKEQPKR